MNSSPEPGPQPAIRWQVAIAPSSLVKPALLWFLFPLEFVVLMMCLAFVVVTGFVSSPWRAPVLVVVLVILGAGLYFMVGAGISLRRASGLIEYEVGHGGITFRNPLTWIQRVTLNQIMYYNSTELTRFLAMESCFIKWDEVASVKVDPDAMTIWVMTPPSSRLADYAMCRSITLICTPATFPEVREYVQTHVPGNPSVAEGSIERYHGLVG